MFIFGQRHIPLSPLYWNYIDCRPMLSQDASQSGWFGFRRYSNPFQRIYYYLNDSTGTKILFSNNTLAHDREQMKLFQEELGRLSKKINLVSLLPTMLFGSVLLKTTSKSQTAFGLFTIYFSVNSLIKSYFSSLNSTFIGYYSKKYNHITVKNLNEVRDKRREFFRPDVSVYYRETAQEIYDKKSAHEQHDGSLYYGPHPFDDHENVESVVETNRKFMEGHSIWDNQDNESLLTEPIDIKRNVRKLPTVNEYRSI